MFFCVLSNCFSRGKADESLGAGKREGTPLEQSRRGMVKAWRRGHGYGEEDAKSRHIEEERSLGLD